jgi:ATP-dependent DNA ligase
MSKYAKRIQRYTNYDTTDEAVRSGKFDLVQPKYDGMWAACVVADGKAKVFSRTGQLKATIRVPRIKPGVLIGEWMAGTQRAAAGDDVFVAFDALAIGGMRLDGLGYRQRIEMAFSQPSSPASMEWVVPARTCPINRVGTLWKHVESGKLEGLVFRSSTDTYRDAEIGRVKATVTTDYVVMDLEPGSGRLADTLGTMVCGVYSGRRLVEKCRIGGGFTDQLRDEIWKSPRRYVGRVVEARGYQLFDSGALRHPQFVRFRDDKLPRECRLTKGGA